MTERNERPSAEEEVRRFNELQKVRAAEEDSAPVEVYWLNVVQAGSSESDGLLDAAREALRRGLAKRFPAHSWRLHADEWEGTDPLASFDHTSYRLSSCCIGDFSSVCFLEDLGPFGPGVVGRLREQSAKIGRYPFDMKAAALCGLVETCND